MEYSRIVAVTGMPGLYEILSSKSDGAIVRSLDDESTRFVSSRVHNLSHLESIEIYTTGDNVSLGDVFTAMKGNAEGTPDVKDSKALKGYFEKVFPQLDTDRVYASDMKKMVNWFAVLEKHAIDYTPKAEEEDENEAESTSTQTTQGGKQQELASETVSTPEIGDAVATETQTEAPVAEAPVKKTRAKKAAPAEASAEGEAATEKNIKGVQDKHQPLPAAAGYDELYYSLRFTLAWGEVRFSYSIKQFVIKDARTPLRAGVLGPGFCQLFCMSRKLLVILLVPAILLLAGYIYLRTSLQSAINKEERQSGFTTASHDTLGGRKMSVADLRPLFIKRLEVLLKKSSGGLYDLSVMLFVAQANQAPFYRVST